MKKKLPKSIQKFIRIEKARIRREVSDSLDQGKLISQLNQRFYKTNENTGNLQPSHRDGKESGPKNAATN